MNRFRFVILLRKVFAEFDISGPSLIHGSADGPMYGLAHKTGTNVYVPERVGMGFDDEGHRMSSEDEEEYFQLFQGDAGVYAKALQYSLENWRQIPAEKSFYDFAVTFSQSRWTDLDDTTAESKRKEFLQYVQLWGAFTGEEVQQSSLKFFWCEDCLEEAQNGFVADTYEKIIKEVGRIAVEQKVIKLSTRVKEIHVADKECAIRPRLVTADGEEFNFDEVVITCPIGWLKINKTAFKPDLDARIVEAIDNIGYSHLDKVLTVSNSFGTSNGTNVIPGLDQISTRFLGDERTV